MGGGGGFFNSVINTVGGIVNGITGSNVINTPDQQKAAAERAAAQEKARVEAAIKAQSDAALKAQSTSAPQAQAQATEGGTPTAAMANTAKNAGSAAALSGSQQAVNQTAGSGTLLTGNEGIDPQSLELGRKTLLGG